MGSEDPEIYCDSNYGLFSAILAAYNNHWALRTRPDDWWNVVLRYIIMIMMMMINGRTCSVNVPNFCRRFGSAFAERVRGSVDH